VILHSFELNNFAVALYSWTFKFCKVVRQHIWGEVVDYITASSGDHPRILYWKNININHICQSYHKNTAWVFYDSQCIFWGAVLCFWASLACLHNLTLLIITVFFQADKYIDSLYHLYDCSISVVYQPLDILAVGREISLVQRLLCYGASFSPRHIRHSAAGSHLTASLVTDKHSSASVFIEDEFFFVFASSDNY